MNVFLYNNRLPTTFLKEMATSFMSEISSYLNKGKGEYSNGNSPYMGKTSVKHTEYRRSNKP